MPVINVGNQYGKKIQPSKTMLIMRISRIIIEMDNQCYKFYFFTSLMNVFSSHKRCRCVWPFSVAVKAFKPDTLTVLWDMYFKNAPDFDIYN